MEYCLVLLSAVPVTFFLARFSNLVSHPISYSYYLGVLFFLTIGSFYVFYDVEATSLALETKGSYIVLLVAMNFTVLYWCMLRSIIARPQYRRKKLFTVADAGRSGTTCSNTQRPSKGQRIVFSTLFCLHATFLVYFIYTVGIDYIAANLSIENDAKTIVNNRTELISQSSGNVTFFLYNLSFLLAATRIAVWGINKKTVCYILYFTVTVLLLLHKAPIIYLAYCIMIVIFAKNERVQLKKIFIFSVSSIVAIILFYYLFFPGKSFNYYAYDLSMKILHRILGVYTEAAALTINKAEMQGFLNGKTLINPLNIFPYEPMYLPGIMHLERYGYEGNLTVPAFAEIYINFGYIASLLFVLITPVVLLITDEVIRRKRCFNSVFIGVSAYLSIGALLLSQTSIFGYLLDPKVIILVFFTLIIGSLHWKKVTV